ncbi:MAG: 5-formyltetrahydrofolate cyclo-ligase [Symploca sp. SIO2E9]|nr:5-formyltetrahydrofolate cyclo-ligase [Symploca sp. SIO2E9]
MSKSELRRLLLKQRQSMSSEHWHYKSECLTKHLRSSPLFTQAQTVLAYFSFRKEPDLSTMFADTERRWGFPRCIDKSLCWHSWKPGEALQKGKYGIFEPYPDAPTIKPSEVDLIIVPAVACDQRGYRLGYGGGFYDRMLSSSEWESKPTIGIIFEQAYLSQLPIDDWDKSLHAVCTEARFNLAVLGKQEIPRQQHLSHE